MRKQWLPPVLTLACLLMIASTAGAQQACPSHASCWKKGSPFLKATQTDARFEPAIPQSWDSDVASELTKISDISEVTTKHRPNILIIYVDDMGWGDPGDTAAAPLSVLQHRISTPWPHPDCA